MSFVHLSCRTTYSLLDGAIRPRDLVKQAAAQNQPAVAMTDHCGLYGAVEFHNAAKKHGIKPIYGATIWVWPPGLADLRQRMQASSAKKTRKKAAPEVLGARLFDDDSDDDDEVAEVGEDGGYAVTLLVKSQVGYQNLCALISDALCHIYHRPRTDLEKLREHAEGLIALVGTHTQLVAGSELAQTVLAVVSAFGADNTCVEVTDYGAPSQAQRAQLLMKTARAANLTVVATNDVRYGAPQDAVTLSLLHSIQLNQSIDTEHVHQPRTDQQYLKKREEMAALGFGEATLDATLQIADRCTFELSTGDYHFPRTEPPTEIGRELPARWRWMQKSFPLPPHAAGGTVELPDEIPEDWSLVELFFAEYARLGLQRRLEGVEDSLHPEYWKRLDYEISTIKKMGFPVYMLIVAEFINWSKARGIPIGPGRGSVAGALSAWAMGITELDSIRFGLIFERFLNPGRQSMPDVDVDFSKVRRQEAIRHVQERYGDDCVAQIATLMACKPKVALKDAARAIGIPFQTANQWTRLIDDGAKRLAACTGSPPIKARLEGDPVFRRAWSLAEGLEDLLRQTGVHAAGVVITDKPLTHYVPTFIDPKTGRKTVCADMDSAETQGLIKYDFLGLITLDVLKLACDLIEQQTGSRPDLNTIPLDDEPTFALLQRGETIGTFQMESSGMRDLIRRLRPTDFAHIIALVALYRPGPLQSGLVDQFVECRHGRQEVTYLWDDLEPILAPTYGAIIYQEQVLEIARVLAGYSLADADLMRRAIGKKKAKEMARQRKQFIAGCMVHGGVPEKIAAELFDIIDLFSGYSFNKSHSAAYGLISYQTAYLKANFPREFMAAVLSWEANEAKLSSYIQEARRMGITVLPPDINESSKRFTLCGDNAIRFGLGSIKGVGAAALREIFRARKHGPFRDLRDFGDRTESRVVGKTVIEALAYSGAFDRFGVPRHLALAKVRPKKRPKKAPALGQVTLFGGGQTVGELEEIKAEENKFFGWRQRMRRELLCLGTWLSGHPLDLFGGYHAQIREAALNQIERLSGGRLINIVGIIAGINQIKNFRGERMAFLTITDDTGWVEVTCFSQTWSSVKGTIRVGDAVVITGRVERHREEVSCIVASIKSLESERQRRAKKIRIEMNIERVPYGAFDRIMKLIADASQKKTANKVPVEIRVIETGKLTATLPLGRQRAVSASPEFFEGLERIGVDPRGVRTI